MADASTSTTLLQSIQYNPAGQMTSQLLANGVVETRDYNARGQLTAVTATQNTATLLNLAYGYGSQNAGRIRQRIDSIQPEHSAQYAYDSTYRLKQAVAANWTWGISWNFDAFGNRTAQTPYGLATGKVGAQTLGYFNNRISGLAYNPAGGVTNDAVHVYSYDGENRIISVDGGAIQYAYDGEGRRVKKTVGSETTYYFYHGTEMISEFTATATGALQASATDRLRYHIAEQTGTTVLTLSPSGMVLENNRVLPYGEPWEPAVGSANAMRFTSYYADAESGLDYAMARFYASRNGRFMSPGANVDLADPQSWNAYVHVQNDPPEDQDAWIKNDDGLRGRLNQYGHRLI